MVLHLEAVAPMVPRVHLNGTGRRGLLDQYVDVLNAGDRLREAMNKAAPHGRDYYPSGDAAMVQARAEHDARRQRLDDLLAEVEAIATAVHDQGSSREQAA